MKENAKYSFTSVLALFVAVFFLLFSTPANASCASPAGVAGNIVYNTSYSMIEYCNGSSWVAVGPYPGQLKEITFNNQSNVFTNTTITSNVVTLVGIFTGTATCNAGCTDIIRNGADCNCTTLSGFVPGDTIAIKQVSSASYGTLTSATVSLGTLTSDSWTVTTMTANAFNFSAVTGQPYSSTIVYTTASGQPAPTITWTGGGTLPVSCTNCSGISINGGAFVSSPTTITSGQTINIEMTSSASPLTNTPVVVTIGSTTATWSVTTGQSCTDTVSSGYDSFTPKANQTISYSLYGGGGGAGGAAGTSGTSQSGTLAVTTSQMITLVAGGGGGGGYYGAGGAGYYGGGCGGVSGTTAGGGGGGSSALIVNGAVQVCAKGGAGGGTGGGAGGTCTGGGANYAGSSCTASGLGFGAGWSGGAGGGVSGGGGVASSNAGGGGGYGGGGGSGSDGALNYSYPYQYCCAGFIVCFVWCSATGYVYWTAGGAGGSNGANGGSYEFTGGIGTDNGTAGASGEAGGNGGSVTVNYIADTCNW